MSATDELRRMLDERGVEWDGWGKTAYGRGTVYEGEYDTVWTADSGDLLSILCETTPEQAIGSTLGRGTCRRVLYKPTKVLVCSECGAGIPKQLDKYCFLHYCPNCGRRVVAGDA